MSAVTTAPTRETANALAVTGNAADQARHLAANASYEDLGAVIAIIDCAPVEPIPMLTAARLMAAYALDVGDDALEQRSLPAESFANFTAATHAAADVLTSAAEKIDDLALWGAAYLAQRASRALQAIDAGSAHAAEVLEAPAPQAGNESEALATTILSLLRGLHVLISHADKISQRDDPRDPQCTAARLLDDAESAVYGLIDMADDSSDMLWRVASAASRGTLSMAHRTLQQAMEKAEGLGVTQMAMLPGAITLAGRLVAVLDLADPAVQLAAARDLETALRTGALLAAPRSDAREAAVGERVAHA